MNLRSHHKKQALRTHFDGLAGQRAYRVRKAAAGLRVRTRRRDGLAEARRLLTADPAATAPQLETGAELFLPGSISGMQAEGGAYADNLYRLCGDWMRGTDMVVPAEPVFAATQVYGGHRLRLIPLSGHTQADLAIYDETTPILRAKADARPASPGRQITKADLPDLDPQIRRRQRAARDGRPHLEERRADHDPPGEEAPAHRAGLLGGAGHEPSH